MEVLSEFISMAHQKGQNKSRKRLVNLAGGRGVSTRIHAAVDALDNPIRLVSARTQLI